MGCSSIESSAQQSNLSSLKRLDNNLSNPSQSNEIVEEPVIADQSIRKIDFRNFTYSWCNNKEFSLEINLINGKLITQRKLITGEEERVKFSLQNVYYYDLTLDRSEEAIVSISSLIEPGIADTCTFVFTIDRGKPKIVWTHNNGDWEDRGLRTIYVEDNLLVVEEYLHYSNKEEIMRTSPNTINRLKYKWDGNDFIQVSTEYFPNDQQGVPFLGYPKNRENYTQPKSN